MPRARRPQTPPRRQRAIISDSWYKYSESDAFDCRLVELKSFYSGNAKSGNKGQAIIVRVPPGEGWPPAESSTVWERSPTAWKSTRGEQPSTRNDKDLYNIFESYRKRGNDDMKAFKITHTKYGITDLVRSAFNVLSDEGTANAPTTAFLMSVRNSADVEALEKILEKVRAAPSVTGSASSGKFLRFREEVMASGAFTKVLKLDDRHCDEVLAAEERLPKMGIVTVVIAFEEYLHNLLDTAFDLIYGMVNSIEDFLKILPESGEDTKNSKHFNIFKKWLEIPNRDFEENLESCVKWNDYVKLKELLPQKWRKKLEKQMNEDNIEVKYECMKIEGTKFERFIHEIVNQHRDIIGQAIGPQLASIVKTVGKIASGNATDAKKIEERFKLILSRFMKEQDQYRSVIMALSYHARIDRHDYFNFRVDSRNIRATIADQEEVAYKHYVTFKIGGQDLFYRLRDKDEDEIMMSYRAYEGWYMFFPEETGQRCRYKVKPLDVETLEHLMRLFYGLRCIFAHGSTDITIRDGALSNTPKHLKVEAIQGHVLTDDSYDSEKEKFIEKILIPCATRNSRESCECKTKCEVVQIEQRCEEYLLGLWKDAIEQRDKMMVDTYLHTSVKNFYQYVAALIGKTLTCCIWNLTPLTNTSKFGMHVRDLDELSAEFFPERVANQPAKQLNMRYPLCRKDFCCLWGTRCPNQHTLEEEQFFLQHWGDGYPTYKSEKCYNLSTEEGCSHKAVMCWFYHSDMEARCYDETCRPDDQPGAPWHTRSNSCPPSEQLTDIPQCTSDFTCLYGVRCQKRHTPKEKKCFRCHDGRGWLKYKRDQCHNRNRAGGCSREDQPETCGHYHNINEARCYKKDCPGGSPPWHHLTEQCSQELHRTQHNLLTKHYKKRF